MIWVSSQFSFCAFVTEIVNGKKAEPGGRPAIDISIEFEIQWKFVILLFITNSADHIEILHTWRRDSKTVVMCAKFRCDQWSTF